MRRFLGCASLIVAVAGLAAGCGRRSVSGGAAGSGGHAGAAGHAGSVGQAGSTGEAGSSGQAGSTADAGEASAPLTEADFCAMKAAAECQVADRCVTDKDACLTARTKICTMFAAQAKASGKRMFVADNVAVCISKTQALYAKTSPITPAELADMSDACQYVFQGNGRVNVDPCDNKFDCADHVVCDKGFCATPRTVTGACGNPGDGCPTGNYCTQNVTLVYVCMPRGPSGASCDSTTPCLESLRCAGGICTDRLPSASACTSSDDCAPAAPFCDPFANNRCDAGLSFSVGSPSCADYGGIAP
ncbi:MAG TPA: hypothetical protein VN903_02715 [Polyangia bacterium]|jgi:hypothetical protein|nr:hypothetical protein [Polyangia bacterium]